MLENSEVQIIIGVFLTSIISGFLGMGGGMILMILYSSILPIKLAMILHGVTQLSSNGFRAHLHRQQIKWSIIPAYITGVIFIFLLFKTISLVPNKATIYILLGAFPFIAFIPHLSSNFSILKKGRAFICGSSVTIAQLLAGASGGLLDIFFLNSSLNRHQIIATKALTQTIGHFIKLVYYFSLITSIDELLQIPIYIYCIVIPITYIGGKIGKLILDNLSDRNFKRISKGILLLTASSLLYKGISLYLYLEIIS